MCCRIGCVWLCRNKRILPPAVYDQTCLYRKSNHMELPTEVKWNCQGVELYRQDLNQRKIFWVKYWILSQSITFQWPHRPSEILAGQFCYPEKEMGGGTKISGVCRTGESHRCFLPFRASPFLFLPLLPSSSYLTLGLGAWTQSGRWAVKHPQVEPDPPTLFLTEQLQLRPGPDHFQSGKRRWKVRWRGWGERDCHKMGFISGEPEFSRSLRLPKTSH